MSSFVRRKVSQNRKRYVDDNYDLDLTYISENIIAMGYPSDKILQSLIRNQIEQVSKYLNEKHTGSFKIFNLCQESDYDFQYFDNMVEHIPIEDHNPPKFVQIDQFCESVDSWLNSKNSNVVIVHCKAGKGRTGTLISCYLLYSKKFPNPFDAMDEFDVKRCIDRKGVTIPSQRRFIEYYSHYLNNSLNYESKIVYLKSIEILLPQDYKTFPKTLRCEIYADYKNKVYDKKQSKLKDKNKFFFELETPAELIDDIRVLFLTKKKAKLLVVSLNTFCLFQFEQYKNLADDRSCLGSIEYDRKTNEICWYLKKKDIDIASKNKNIDPDLTVLFRFDLGQNEVPINMQEYNSSEINTTNDLNSSPNNMIVAKKSKPKLYKSFKKFF